MAFLRARRGAGSVLDPTLACPVRYVEITGLFYAFGRHRSVALMLGKTAPLPRRGLPELPAAPVESSLLSGASALTLLHYEFSSLINRRVSASSPGSACAVAILPRRSGNHFARTISSRSSSIDAPASR